MGRRAKGLFHKHGIETEIIVTGQGATAGIGALLANDIQIASAGGDSLVNAALRGGETVMIAAGVNRGLNRIMVRPDIKTPADLKGRKIGATRIGAVSHSVLLMMLKRWNMSPADVQVLQLGSSPNMLQALDKGGIDGAVMTIPFRFYRRGSRFSGVSRSGGNGHLLSSHHDRVDAKLPQGQSRPGVKVSQGLLGGHRVFQA